MPLSWCCRDQRGPNQPLQATAESTPRLSGKPFGKRKIDIRKGCF